MSFKLRTELGSSVKKIVVKIGSAALASPEGAFSQEQIQRIVSDCSDLWSANIQTVIVSSGAILAGRSHLAAHPDPDITFFQALSAIGQPLLMRAYSEAFYQYGRNCAQVLLTHEDIKSRTRYLNLKGTVFRLIEAGIIPILNENDSVSFAEITVGDNDQLAAMVAAMIEADCLVMLSTPDGLFDRDPSCGEAQKISHVNYKTKFDDISIKGKSNVGRGGMQTKLEAVRKVTPLGIPVILSTFKRERPLLTALADNGGTFFESHPEVENRSRKKRLVVMTKPNSAIKIDDGARDALLQNSSLLSSGIKSVDGEFKRGDCVKIMCREQEIAIGLVEYSAADLRLIKGCKSSEIKDILGYVSSKVVVHRDHMVIKK